MKRLAADVYLMFRVYQHYLQENNLNNDSETITVGDLIDFCDNQITNEDYERISEEIEEFY